MSIRTDYQRIGDLVLLCAQTMRMLSVDKRGHGIDCPFQPTTYQLEALSREIKLIADDLPADWDMEIGLNLHS